MRKSINVMTSIETYVLSALLFLLINVAAYGQCDPQTLSGHVFIDTNYDGIIDSDEYGKSGIFIKVYNTNGQLIGQSVTDADGDFEVTGTTDDQKYLVRFDIPEFHFLSRHGLDNSTDVQFVQSPACDITMGLLDSNSSCNEKSEILISCFVNNRGDNFGTQPTIVGTSFDFTETSAVNVYATKAETGSVWGMAYNDHQRVLYSSAFVKQHADLTAHGHDAIFVTDVNGTPSTQLFTNLSTLGQAVGTMTTTDASHCDFGKQVGTIGLGALDVDDYNDYMYVTNLFNNTIVKIDINNPVESTTQSFVVPNPGCSFNDYRVFAVKYYQDELYVGVTCTAETSLDEDDTNMHVYRMDINSGNANLIFSSDYSRGAWNLAVNDQDIYQQWLTDIDFTDEGNMVLGLSDRLGHIFCSGSSSRVDDQIGDILLVEYLNGQWILENNGQTSKLTGTGVDNEQGPGGGEFFGDDFFPLNQNNHPEVGVGSFYVMPGTGEIVSAVFDPLYSTYSGGMHRYRTDNGSRVSAIELYNKNISEYFGKGTGFGDVVAICGTVPPVIGNLAWHDKNCDGIQNADEEGVADLVLNIYNEECDLVGTTTTDANGNYIFDNSNVDRNQDGYFDGLIGNTNYYVAIDPNVYDQNVQSYKLENIYFDITSGNGSDEFLNSNALIDANICPGSPLENMHIISAYTLPGNSTTFDLGLKPATTFDLALVKKQTSTKNIKNNDVVTFEITVYNQGRVIANEYEIVDYLTPAFTFVPELNDGWILGNDQILRKIITTPLLPLNERTETLKLRINTSLDPVDYINVAEIGSAKDNFDEIADDIDSTPDETMNNDAGGEVETNTDDLYTDDGTIDEDDHDPAQVKVLDLALKNIIKDARLYDVDEVATFEMTVCNQGNLAVSSFEITNSFPNTLRFEASLNTEFDWEMVNPETIKLTRNQIFNPGEKVTVSINLKVVSNNDFEDIINLAEISNMVSVDPEVTYDIDSTPDAITANDNGGDPYNFTDNLITDNGLIDEDDHDPAILAVRLVDLALMKTTPKLVYNPGDNVEFEITIYNQGEVTASHVGIVDYLPENTTLVSSDWQVDPTDLSGRTVFKDIEFDGGLSPNEEHKEYIVVNINEDVPTGFVINEAEIAQVIDLTGIDVSNFDIDSNPDMDNSNDMGGEFASGTDDVITDDGTMDEDDHDPAGFYIADISISESCNCLDNATNQFDGQFIDTIIVTAPSGQAWFIDDVHNLFDPTSAAPPAAPTPYITGAFGYVLSETVIGGGVSEYQLLGIFVQNERYTIRVTNGEGAYLQIGGGGALCKYDESVILSPTNGLSAVCSGSLHTYSFDDLFGCTNYTWSLSSGGTIVGANDEETVTVQWDVTPGGPHVLQLTPNCVDMCISPVITEINIGNEGTLISCVNELNVSLNDNCSTQLTPELFLTTPINPGISYQLMVTDKFGATIPNGILTEDHLWTEVTAKVVDPCSGNSCWATVNVEDKMAPEIYCGSISLPCWLMNTYEPLVIDNCTEASFELIGETTQPLDCDPNFIKEVTRTYIAIDEFGNESAPCEQVISLRRIDFDEIDFPSNFLLEDDTNLTCVDSIYDENGVLDTKITGVPSILGHPIYPIQDLYCNVGIEFEDVEVADFGCFRKIMRTWTIYEAWCTVGVVDTYVQQIEIADTEDPVVECPQDIIVSSQGGADCETDVNLTLPIITDDCSTEFIIDINHDNGFIENVTSDQIVTLPAGTSIVTYNVYDQCDNLSTCETVVTVIDQANPVAICDEFTTVSLRSNGTAKAFAHTFDDGSYDDCSLFRMLVRRMNSNCECDRPEFNDMRFLGERAGRYYYLSKFKTHGGKAFDYSTAFGGMLLTLESEEEHDWVYEQVSNEIEGTYYIGLSDFDHQGEFTWYNHAEPTFSRWENVVPNGNAGDHVVVNNNGNWMVVNGNHVETYYVMELSDPCGFSDEIHFCCEDVTEEQMVVFRVVDYFGRTNECMVNVEVQDKVPPKLTCPPSDTISCEKIINLDNLVEFGIAVASDQCSLTQSDTVFDYRNNCGFGDIVRRFKASDLNGYSTCDQRLTVINTKPFDNTSIIMPEEFTTDLGCDSGGLLPENLPEPYSGPKWNDSNCSQVAATYEDKTYTFSAPGSEACLKILRTWTVIDWCQFDDPDYTPVIFDQVIKVNNVVGPEIHSGCDSLVINTFDCDSELVVFSATATDDCTPGDDLRARLQIDIDSDGLGTYDIEAEVTSDVISFNNHLPIGEHFALISFIDRCNNVTSCAKIIQINNVKNPTAACINGLSVALEPMDLDNDGFPDTEMACIFPEMVDASSTHLCGHEINLSFSQDTAHDKLAFECIDIGVNFIELWVTDEFGNTDYCETTIEVQDNNMVDFCPSFDLALIKRLDTVATPGPFSPGDDVVFDLEIINQGNIPAYNVELVDYIPDGLELNDANWSESNGKAYLIDPIAFLEDSMSVHASIRFTITQGFMGFSITNVAEIADADDDDIPNNEELEDSDSEPDDENDDTIGGDDEVNNDNNDEDDHDPETIEVQQTFDLSLDKDCNSTTAGPFMPGSTVIYDISVTNEGTLDASNVFVADHIPNGLTLDDSNWTASNGTAVINTPIPFIAVGQTETVTITFVINDGFMDASITNVAEIVDPNNELLDDVDSDPDNDDGDQSEDDEDNKTITVGQVFDLALTKVVDAITTPGPYQTGDDVAFVVTVYNQGSLNANAIQIMDYIPDGFTLDPLKNSDFINSGSNASAVIAFLASDDIIELRLVLTIDDDFTGSELINNAEIISAVNAMGLVDQGR